MNVCIYFIEIPVNRLDRLKEMTHLRILVINYLITNAESGDL